MMKTKRTTFQLTLAITTLLMMMGLFLMPIGGTLAQGGPTPTQPAATRVPPTKVPAPPATATPSAIAMSGIAQIQESGKLRVGTLFNAPPFSWLDEKGDIVGYEVEVLRSVAVDLGVDIEFIQVTSETAEQMLLTGEVDMVIGRRIHTKDAEAFMDFSQTYFYNFQKIVVRQDSGMGSFADLANRRAGVIVGSRAETALNRWVSQSGSTVTIQRYLTRNEALDAVANGQVDAMAGDFMDLRRAGRQGMSFLSDSLELDPYAIAFRRFDVNLKNAINRALQRLNASGRMDQIAENWFDEEERAVGTNFAALIPVYEDFDSDTRSIDDFPPDIPKPNSSILDKIRNGGTLNVAGLSLNDAEVSWKRFMDPLNREIVREMARRWGVDVVFLPDTFNAGADKIVTGEADLAIGVSPRWDGADRVDYSVPYHNHSNKIIVYEGSRYRIFTDLRGGSWLGYYADDPQHEEDINVLSEFFNTRPAIYSFISNSQVYEQMIGTRDVDALYGDSIRLQDFMLNNSPELWRFLQSSSGDFNYKSLPFTMAVPRNDQDFLSLVNWTLGDMYSDGTLQRIWDENYQGSEPPPFIPDWPGDGDFLLNGQ